MTDFSTAVSAHPYIDALTSDGGAASALTDGATYDVDLHYSDNIGNAASTTVSRTGLFFAGSSTLPPTFARPAENGTSCTCWWYCATSKHQEHTGSCNWQC